MKRLFDFNASLWKKVKENKILSIALIVFVTFSVVNSILVYNFVQVLSRI